MSTLQEMRAEFYDLAAWTPELAAYVREKAIPVNDVIAHAGTVGMCSARFHPGRRFDFNADGLASIVIESLDRDDITVVDLVAWPTGRPEKFATAFGAAPGLGSAAMSNPASYFLGSPLRMFRTPLRWLQERCDGAVILDAAAVPTWLGRALGPVAGEDAAHAREIVQLLRQRPPLPQVLVPRRAAA